MNRPPRERSTSRQGRQRSASVTDQVIEAVLTLLRSGRYRIGDRLLSEWELVRQLGVGRSAVREALRELAALGVVDIHPGRGTFVRSLRPDLLMRPDLLAPEVNRALIREYLEVRQIVEPGAATLAAVRADDADLLRMTTDIDCLAKAVNMGYRPPEDLGFHLDIVRATHNTALTRIAASIVSYYQRDEHLPTERDVREHLAILQAIRERDPDRAREAIRSHLDSETAMMEGGVEAGLLFAADPALLTGAGFNRSVQQGSPEAG
jgi:GntR family transcriptional repressor for pyruvate dehydrogenase complex